MNVRNTRVLHHSKINVYTYKIVLLIRKNPIRFQESFQIQGEAELKIAQCHRISTEPKHYTSFFFLVFFIKLYDVIVERYRNEIVNQNLNRKKLNTLLCNRPTWKKILSKYIPSAMQNSLS